MPEVAVIIPVLDEEDTLGPLLKDLALQEGVTLEVAVADGGSRDGTGSVFRDFGKNSPFPLKWVDAPKGRASQMNRGAASTSAPVLLFLHADTRLPDRKLISGGLRKLAELTASRGGCRIAGHFGLDFDTRENRAFYYYFEAKTRTGRPHTINGDQGTLIARSFFEEAGGFDESLPFMEDAAFERTVREKGEWTLLPGTVVTSARRFEEEGRIARQTLNALLRNFNALGLNSFLADGKRVYAEARKPGRLFLAPFLKEAHRTTLGRGVGGWLQTWLKTGAFVRDNAWQLPFMFFCRTRRKKGLLPEGDLSPLYARFERVFDALTSNPAGWAFSAVLTFSGFYILWFFVWVAGLIRRG